MTREEFLERIADINTWRQGGQRAPHKPLLLLLALGRVLADKERLIPWRYLEPGLRDLLKRFGRPSQTLHPEHPFRRLCNDGLWEVPGINALARTASDDFLVGDLRTQDAKGGFPRSAYDRLRERPELALEAAGRLLHRHFPSSLHAEIRAAVGIPQVWRVQEEAQSAEETPRRMRDPAFRPGVLREYERRCAICDFDVRLGDELLGLEAAHIQWHSHGGPEHVSNGLALCVLHHKALDRGALGVEARDGGFNVMVSREVIGSTAPANWILDYHRRPIRPPLDPALAPKLKFVCWHQREVFRSPPLP